MTNRISHKNCLNGCKDGRFFFNGIALWSSIHVILQAGWALNISSAVAIGKCLWSCDDKTLFSSLVNWLYVILCMCLEVLLTLSLHTSLSIKLAAYSHSWANISSQMSILVDFYDPFQEPTVPLITGLAVVVVMRANKCRAGVQRYRVICCTSQ